MLAVCVRSPLAVVYDCNVNINDFFKSIVGHLCQIQKIDDEGFISSKKLRNFSLLFVFVGHNLSKRQLILILTSPFRIISNQIETDTDGV